MIITHTNRVVPGLAISASSTASGLLVSNLAHNHKSKVWQSGTSSSSEWVEVDFGAAVAISAAGLVNHNIAAPGTLTLKANTSSSWGSPAFSVAITPSSPNQIQKLASTQTYRYWRLEIGKTSSGFVAQLGCLILGAHYDFAQQPTDTGYRVRWVDPSKHNKTPSGQRYSEILPKFRQFRLDWSMVDSTLKTNVETAVNNLGTSLPFLMQVESTGELTEYVYARFTDEPDFSVQAMDETLRWGFTLDAEEEL